MIDDAIVACQVAFIVTLPLASGVRFLKYLFLFAPPSHAVKLVELAPLCAVEISSPLNVQPANTYPSRVGVDISMDMS